LIISVRRTALPAPWFRGPQRHAEYGFGDDAEKPGFEFQGKINVWRAPSVSLLRTSSTRYSWHSPTLLVRSL